MTNKEIEEANEYLANLLARNKSSYELDKLIKDSPKNLIFIRAVEIQKQKGWR